MKVVFEHVSKSIGKKTVVDDMSFEITSGTIVGLKGINGAGKTMIMRLIAGFIYPTSGIIKIDDNVLGKDIDFPSKLGCLIENPAFLDWYSGYDNLRILADINHIVSEERIQYVMNLVGLKENGNKKYKKFSLGMRQRLGIAAAILEKPDLLLLDEPTNSLDESGVTMLKDIIFSEKKRGAIVFLSCHDELTLTELSDTIFEIKNGKIESVLRSDINVQSNE